MWMFRTRLAPSRNSDATLLLRRTGSPSHWNTLRAMRVLDWYGAAAEPLY
jgi:hypothetical protein